MPGVLSDFVESLKALGPAPTRPAQRREWREVVGALGDDLETALDLTLAYLRSASRLSRPGALADFLSDAPAKLRDFYRQLHISRGLHDLTADRKPLFRPKRSGATARGFDRVTGLVAALARGDRSVLDDLKDLMGTLANTAEALRAARGPRAKSQVERARQMLVEAASDVERQRRSVQESVRKALDGF
jgi:hypothetical protein